jgi:hypothetical protein
MVVLASFGPNIFSDGIIQYRFRVISTTNQLLNGDTELGFRNQSNINGNWTEYILAFDPKNKSFNLVYQEKGGNWQAMQKSKTGGSASISVNEWTTVRIEVGGNNFNVYINGNLIISSQDARDQQGALYLGAIGNIVAQFDDIKVWETK